MDERNLIEKPVEDLKEKELNNSKVTKNKNKSRKNLTKINQ